MHDCKFSHIDDERYYLQHDQMTFCRGKKYPFVGIDMEYSDNKQGSYINECIEAFGGAVTTGESNSAVKYL